MFSRREHFRRLSRENKKETERTNNLSGERERKREREKERKRERERDACKSETEAERERGYWKEGEYAPFARYIRLRPASLSLINLT